MQLIRVLITNYRNFSSVDCRVGQHVVLLGENGVGKSNLLRAIRLVLDPELPESDRWLDSDDFWVGVTPFAGNEIVISLEFSDYDKDPLLLACLGDFEVAAPSGWTKPVARITYRYAPKGSIPEAKRPGTRRDDYEYSFHGGDDTANEVRGECRRALVFKFLHALRDAETDLRVWRRSPLRPLIDNLSPPVASVVLDQAAAAMDSATGAVIAEKPLEELRSKIESRLKEMIGSQHGVVPALGFASTDPSHLLRALRLFVDPKRRWEVSDTSLGLANVLYLSLLLLNTSEQEAGNRIASMILGVEEPEAHLHPQMQRRVFRDLLSRKRPLLVSTHSPNIASVAPIESIVLLKTVGNATSLSSMASASGFTAQQLNDLTRYLDVTRAEILFGRGVVLVEGDAEEFIVPAAAQLLDPPIELDEYGITVCSVSGVDFAPYARMLHHLGVPFVVITDGDARDALGQSVAPGIARGVGVLEVTKATTAAERALILATTPKDAATSLAKMAIFVGDRTLEADMLAAGAGQRMAAAFRDLNPGTKDATLAHMEKTGRLDDAGEDLLIGLIRRLGKGRFAQRLAETMTVDDVPSYLRDGIRRIVALVQHV